jgi:hypothetical protein
MAEAAPEHSSQPTSAVRPKLELITAPPAASPEMDDGMVGRNAMIGLVIGFVLVASGITVAGTIGGLGFMPSLGLGVFVGAFSGAGFGFMFGATIPLARQLDTHSARAPQGETHGIAAR